jgi:NAD-dependent SIR2 family protein deacetylase
MHHIVNEINQREQCVYCGNNLSDKRWYSEHSMEHHYKSVECGERVRVKVNFIGSGHDTWDKTIEDKIKK